MLRRMDFSNPTTATNTFTCPSDGYVFLHSNNVSTNAIINQTEIPVYRGANNEANYPIPVSKDDVITRSSTLGTLSITFVPELV